MSMDPYAVTRLTVSEILMPGPAGQQMKKKQVTYYVGSNGPFFLQYNVTDYNATQVQADIQKEVNTLQAVKAAMQQG